MSRQITNHVMMIRPAAFSKNKQTAVNNFFQKNGENKGAHKRALKQFDDLVEKLRSEGVEVRVFQDSETPHTPDALFPNNWISFHSDATVRLYPMYAENRRLERREDIIGKLASEFVIKKKEYLIEWENQGKYLEGTGSFVLDRENRIAYAAISDRTHPDVLHDFCEKAGYRAVSFHANHSVENRRMPIYHTNVMMCIGERFALVCAESIDSKNERETLLTSLRESGKELIEISEIQRDCFAGNMLELIAKSQKRVIVMSSAAHESLHQTQIRALSQHGKLLHSDLSTIETLGGGSARCMIAEIFLTKME